MKSHPTPSMTTFRSILHILNIHFSFLSSLLIKTAPIYANSRKKTLEWLANTGRKVKDSIKRNAKLGLVGLTLFSPLLFAGKTSAKDIEGFVAIYYHIDTIGIGDCNFSFFKGAEYGWDPFDRAYYEMPYPTDAHVDAIGIIEGKRATGIVVPPLTDTIGSSGGTSFNGSIVVNSGKSVTLENALHYLKCWFRGLEGCKVLVNGQDISTNSTVNLGTLTGTFGNGEHPTATWTVYVEYVGTNGGGEDPTEPNETGETNQDVEKPAPGRLLIENVISRSSQITSVELALEDGATEGIKEGEDTLYTRFALIPPPAILSRIGETYLTADKRPNTSNSNFFLEQVFFSHSGSAYNPWTQENSLVFTFPEENGKINEKFPGRILTLQEYVPSINDPNIPDPNAMTYPVYLIRDLIEDGNGVGVVNLSDMPKGTIYAGTWHNFILRTDAKTVPLAIADFDSNGRVDSNDVSMLESAIGHVGNSKYDIAGTNSKGKTVIGIAPDGIVDEKDRNALLELKKEDEKRRGVQYPTESVDSTAEVVLSEGFERPLGEAWSFTGDLPWQFDLGQAHGDPCIRAGAIEGGQTSGLVLQRDCVKGTIRFWRCVSSESGFDVYRFFINGTLQEEISGEVGWRQVSFPIVQEGINRFEWRYEKDSSMSMGADTVWIDDVEIAK